LAPVPAVLARGSADEADEADPWSSLPGPTWREEHADWEAHEEVFEPAMLAQEDERPGSLDESAEPGERQPWSFELPGTPGAATPPAPEERQGADDDTLVVPAVRRHEVVEEVAFHFDESEGPAAEPPEVSARRSAARRGLGGHGLRLTGLRHATSEPAEEPAGAGEGAEEPAADGGATARPTRGAHHGGRARRAPAGDRVVPVVDGRSPRTGTGAPRPWPAAVARPVPETRGERNLAVAAVSGIVLGAVALVFFKMGTVTSMVVVTAALVLAGVIGILLGSDYAIVWWAGILGCANAVALVLMLALPALLAPPEDVHRLSAAMFSVSYSFALALPILGGYAWDKTGIPALAFAPIAVAALAILGLSPGLRLRSS